MVKKKISILVYRKYEGLKLWWSVDVSPNSPSGPQCQNGWGPLVQTVPVYVIDVR